jgi:hypothetical protein
MTVNPALVVTCSGGHTCHVGINDWVVKTRPAHLSLGYWFKNEKLSIGADSSVDIRDNSMNYVRLLGSFNLDKLNLLVESSLVNSEKAVYDKNVIIGSILDYSDKLKLFGSFATELTGKDADLAIGFQYALDQSTVLKGKVDNKNHVALSLLKNYRKFVDFGFIVRVSTVNRKTNQFNPKFNFGLSLNVFDI